MLWLDDSLVARFTLQKRALIFSLITILILFVFQPFGTYESKLHYKYLRLAGYGVTTFLAIFIAGMIEIALCKHRENIRIYPLLIIGLYISIAAVLNHSYFVVAILGQWHWQNQLMFIFYVSAIAIFPVAILYFRSNKIPCSVEKMSNKNVPIEIDVDQKSVQFQIIGENKSDILDLAFNNIILMKSADNYCEIITTKDNETTVNLLRISLSKALTQLPPNNLIVRCHRSFSVNLSLVKRYRGNANGLRLEMQFSDIVVPVSRAYVNDVKQALSFLPEQS